MSKVEIINKDIFKIGKYEFIKFADENGNIIGVLKECLEDKKFGSSNDFSKSDILTMLNEKFLPEIEEIVGAKNILEFETDLTSLDGSKKHGAIRSKVSLPTFDFYRTHRALFAKYNLDKWWWLSTPHTTREFANDWWVCCVSPLGYINYYNYDVDVGVRPILIFKSSIFNSLDK